jgi:hypothetical protein
MNPNTDSNGRNLTTADLARAGARPRAPDARADGGNDRQDAERTPEQMQSGPRSEKLDALFTPEATSDFRSQWIDIQARFVDDPRQAVRDGDELVAKVMKSLAESFAHERGRVEAQLKDGSDASTESLRVALRRYRSFFERLLTL